MSWDWIFSFHVEGKGTGEGHCNYSGETGKMEIKKSDAPAVQEASKKGDPSGSLPNVEPSTPSAISTTTATSIPPSSLSSTLIPTLQWIYNITTPSTYDESGRPRNRKKRRRTTDEEHAALEAAYRLDPQMPPREREKLAKTLNMPVKSVQIWFQNRRQTAKKTQDGTWSGMGKWQRTPYRVENGFKVVGPEHVVTPPTTETIEPHDHAGVVDAVHALIGLSQGSEDGLMSSTSSNSVSLSNVKAATDKTPTITTSSAGGSCRATAAALASIQAAAHAGMMMRHSGSSYAKVPMPFPVTVPLPFPTTASRIPSPPLQDPLRPPPSLHTESTPPQKETSPRNKASAATSTPVTSPTLPPPPLPTLPLPLQEEQPPLVPVLVQTFSSLSNASTTNSQETYFNFAGYEAGEGLLSVSASVGDAQQTGSLNSSSRSRVEDKGNNDTSGSNVK
ncbi:hypothetical protein BC832DRAFT_460159 [Gaertneriomyces semiglobifer]|nr:hypothetical protein BC832DRAFT_460159 [Gaertneriomyces semiglobifer]